LFAYRTSVGDLEVPNYDHWYEETLVCDDEDPSLQMFQPNYTWFERSFMMNFTYLFWLGNQYICMIILLNFLIANMSAQYDETMGNKKQLEYQQKIAMNMEHYMFKFFFQSVWQRIFKTKKPYEMLVFTSIARNQDEQDAENEGFVKTIKNKLNQTNKLVTKKHKETDEKLVKHLEAI